MTTTDRQWASQGMRSPREDCNIVADFVIDGRVHMGIIKNKSDTGVYLEVMGSFSIGQEVTLTFTVPGKLKPTKKKGTIARITPVPAGFGVEFSYG